MTLARASLLVLALAAAKFSHGAASPPPGDGFGLESAKAKRWEQERPTEHNLDGLSEEGLIDRLSGATSSGRGLRAVPWSRGSTLTPRQIRSATRYLEQGRWELAWRALRRGVKWLLPSNQREAVRVHALLAELASVYVDMGDFDQAVRIYEQMLLGSRFLQPRYTGFALNQLIATHFERQEYDAALMYVRVGIAVLDDLGVRPYLTMNRIIREMSRLDTALEEFERDFEAAVQRLEEAAMQAQAEGLDVEAQWWAPVYAARHDPDEAIRIFKVLLAPLRTEDAADILRDAVLHEERNE